MTPRPARVAARRPRRPSLWRLLAACAREDDAPPSSPCSTTPTTRSPRAPSRTGSPGGTPWPPAGRCIESDPDAARRRRRRRPRGARQVPALGRHRAAHGLPRPRRGARRPLRRRDAAGRRRQPAHRGRRGRRALAARCCRRTAGCRSPSPASTWRSWRSRTRCAGSTSPPRCASRPTSGACGCSRPSSTPSWPRPCAAAATSTGPASSPSRPSPAPSRPASWTGSPSADEADLLDVVQAWALTCADDLDGALGPLRRVRRHVEAEGGLWLRGYTDLALARLLVRLAERDDDPEQRRGGHRAARRRRGRLRRRRRPPPLPAVPARAGPALPPTWAAPPRRCTGWRPTAPTPAARTPAAARCGRRCSSAAAGCARPSARPRCCAGTRWRTRSPGSATGAAPSAGWARCGWAWSRCRWPSSTSTGSRRSTTRPRTPTGTPSCAGSPTCCASTAAPATRCTAGPATSSSSCCRRRPRRRPSSSWSGCASAVAARRLDRPASCREPVTVSIGVATAPAGGRRTGVRAAGGRCSTPPTCTCSPPSAAAATGCARPGAATAPEPDG